MIDHISIGSSHLARAKGFYDAILEPLGYRCLASDETAIGYGTDKISFWVLASDVPVPPNDGSGLHICFAAPSRRSVDDFHAAAVIKGGKDNGAPGLRSDYGADYYAAFSKDPDGYRLEAYCSKPE